MSFQKISKYLDNKKMTKRDGINDKLITNETLCYRWHWTYSLRWMRSFAHWILIWWRMNKWRRSTLDPNSCVLPYKRTNERTKGREWANESCQCTLFLSSSSHREANSNIVRCVDLSEVAVIRATHKNVVLIVKRKSKFHEQAHTHYGIYDCVKNKVNQNRKKKES